MLVINCLTTYFQVNVVNFLVMHFRNILLICTVFSKNKQSFNDKEQCVISSTHFSTINTMVRSTGLLVLLYVRIHQHVRQGQCVVNLVFTGLSKR